jgi:hypothetical protein
LIMIKSYCRTYVGFFSSSGQKPQPHSSDPLCSCSWSPFIRQGKTNRPPGVGTSKAAALTISLRFRSASPLDIVPSLHQHPILSSTHLLPLYTSISKRGRNARNCHIGEIGGLGWGGPSLDQGTNILGFTHYFPNNSPKRYRFSIWWLGFQGRTAPARNRIAARGRNIHRSLNSQSVTILRRGMRVVPPVSKCQRYGVLRLRHAFLP